MTTGYSTSIQLKQHMIDDNDSVTTMGDNESIDLLAPSPSPKRTKAIATHQQDQHQHQEQLQEQQEQESKQLPGRILSPATQTLHMLSQRDVVDGDESCDNLRYDMSQLETDAAATATQNSLNNEELLHETDALPGTSHITRTMNTKTRSISATERNHENDDGNNEDKTHLQQFEKNIKPSSSSSSNQKENREIDVAIGTRTLVATGGVLSFQTLIKDSSLVCFGDKGLVADHIIVAMAQMRPIKLSNSNFMSYCCNHCQISAQRKCQPGRYIVKSRSRWYYEKKILHHLTKGCEGIPLPIRDAIIELQRSEMNKKGVGNSSRETAKDSLGLGLKRRFLQRVWGRLHSENVALLLQDSQSNAKLSVLNRDTANTNTNTNTNDVERDDTEVEPNYVGVDGTETNALRNQNGENDKHHPRVESPRPSKQGGVFQQATTCIALPLQEQVSSCVKSPKSNIVISSKTIDDGVSVHAITLSEEGPLGMTLSKIGPTTNDRSPSCFVRKVKEGSQAKVAGVLPGDIFLHLTYDEVLCFGSSPRPICFPVTRVKKQVSHADDTISEINSILSQKGTDGHSVTQMNDAVSIGDESPRKQSYTLSGKKPRKNDRTTHHAKVVQRKVGARNQLELIVEPAVPLIDNKGESNHTGCGSNKSPRKQSCLLSEKNPRKDNGSISPTKVGLSAIQQRNGEFGEQPGLSSKPKAPFFDNKSELEKKVPFCRACNDDSRSILLHHALCPDHPHFHRSGAEEKLKKILRGFESGCEACEFEYKNGRKHRHLAHLNSCERSILLSRKEGKQANTQFNQDSNMKGSNKEPIHTKEKRRRKPIILPKKRSQATKNQTQNIGSVSGLKKTQESQIILANTVENGSSTIIQSRNNVTPSSPPPPPHMNDPYASKDTVSKTQEPSSKPTWISCPNPWGQMGHADCDVVLVSPSNSFKNYESVLPSERFSVDPFHAQSDYHRTHACPQDGYHVLRLARDRMALRPWGFTIRRHDFGGACLVESIDSLSPAEAAIHIGSPDLFVSSSREGSAGVRLNDMVLCVNGTVVGGMTEVELSMKLDICGSELILVVSRYKESAYVSDQASKAAEYVWSGIDQECVGLREWNEMGGTEKNTTPFQFSPEVSTRQSDRKEVRSCSVSKLPTSRAKGHHIVSINNRSSNKSILFTDINTGNIAGDTKMDTTPFPIFPKDSNSLTNGETSGDRLAPPALHTLLEVISSESGEDPGEPNPTEDNSFNDDETAQHELSDYELLRLRNIDRNNARLKDLGLLKEETPKDHQTPRKRKKNAKDSAVKKKLSKVLTRQYFRDASNQNNIEEVERNRVSGTLLSGRSRGNAKIDAPQKVGYASSCEELCGSFANGNQHDRGEDGKWIDDGEAWLGCVCGVIHPPPQNVFWIQCDDCEAWYNVAGKCVGFGENDAKSLSTWSCWACAGTNPSTVNSNHSSIIFTTVLTERIKSDAARSHKFPFRDLETASVNSDHSSKVRSTVVDKERKEAEIFGVGTLVNVAKRTGPNENNLGGVGNVMNVHTLHGGDIVYEVCYVLGGRERNVAADYVKRHDFGSWSSDDTSVRTSRSRGSK